MDQIQASNVGKHEQLWASQVADEVRGVPFPLQKTWRDNDNYREWYKRLAQPQSIVYDVCQLYFFAKDTAARSKDHRDRSRLLYEKKMENDMKPMRVVTCANHPNDAEMGPCIPLGK